LAYLENSLNQYDSYSYNLALHMVHPDSAGLLDAAIANGKTIVMADNSQESRYNISDVEQTFKVGFGQVRSTYGNMFTIKIHKAQHF